MSTVRPHTQNTVAAANAALGGHRGEVVHSRVLPIFTRSFNAFTAYSEKRGFSLNAPKTVFRWWCVTSELVCPGDQIFPQRAMCQVNGGTFPVHSTASNSLIGLRTIENGFGGKTLP